MKQSKYQVGDFFRIQEHSMLFEVIKIEVENEQYVYGLKSVPLYKQFTELELLKEDKI